MLIACDMSSTVRSSLDVLERSAVRLKQTLAGADA
jgi:hypothetical protein